jgi:hypothetical protein
MDKQKEANEKRFHDRATLNRDISEIRGSINASLYNLLKQDECRVDALNDRIKNLQDQRKLFKKPEISEVPKRKHIPPFELSRIHNDLGVGCDDFLLSDPWDFEYRYAFSSGDVTLDVIADKPTGHMEVSAKNDIEFISGVSAARVGSMLGSSFSPSPHDGLLLLRGDPFYFYDWQVNVSWFNMASVYALAAIQVDRYTMDNVFDQTVVNNTTMLWSYTAFTWSLVRDSSDSDAYLITSLDVDSNHRYVVWVKFEVGIETDGSGPFWWADASAFVNCKFAWLEGGFCPSD